MMECAGKALAFADIGCVVVSGCVLVSGSGARAGWGRELLEDPDVGRLFLGG
jgi:branched-chain amino acid transport system ATP-binding protein